MKSLSGVEKIIFRALVAAFLTIGTWKKPQAEGTIAPRHYSIQVLRRTDGRVARSLLNQMVSTNWSGYVAASFATGQTYTSAQGTWVVPTVTYFPDPRFSAEYSSTWVGIGGFCENANCTVADNSLLQLGTEQDASSTRTRYYAWYEALPNSIKKIPMSIRPGDTIRVSLQLISAGNKGQSWTLQMEDATGVRTQTWSTTLRYNSSRLSAEWIEEAPSSSGGILPLAEYGPNSTSSPAPAFDFGLASSGSSPLTTSEGLVMGDPWGQSRTPLLLIVTAMGLIPVGGMERCRRVRPPAVDGLAAFLPNTRAPIRCRASAVPRNSVIWLKLERQNSARTDE